MFAATPPVAQRLPQLPLAFEAQSSGSQDLYVARGSGYAVGLHDGSATIDARRGPDGAAGSVRMEFAGGKRVSGVPGAELPGKVNLILGNDPKRWRYGLATYQRVEYDGVYPGVDVIYHGNQQQLEFDLVAKPGVDLDRVRLKFGGVRKLAVGRDGGLTIESACGDLRIPLPVVYQEAGGERRIIQGRYELLAGNAVAFRVEDYDKSQPLVIDPTIVYSGLLAGDRSGAGYGEAVAVDSSNNAYVAGYTSASDLATVNAAFAQYNGGNEGFVEKINAAGTAVLYSTYIGGRNNEVLRGAALDSSGNLWVTGYSNSPDFPVTGGAFQSTYNPSGNNAVVFKLSASGSLLYSTYLGPSGTSGYAVAVDGSGNAYATGTTVSGLATSPGAFQAADQGGSDAYVVEFSSSGAVLYATYLGGASTDNAYGIAVDSAGDAYVTGTTFSNLFVGAPSGGAQSLYTGTADAFVAKLNPTGTALLYFTFLGGSTGQTTGYAIAVDSSGNAYVAGQTNAVNLPTSGGAYQTSAAFPSANDLNNGFVAKLNAAGTTFTYLTYLGGNRNAGINGIAVDSSGDALVTGGTNSNQFPTSNAIEGSYPSNPTSLFQTTNQASSWSAFDTNLPGAVNALSVDPTSSSILVAATQSGIFRTTNGGSSWSLQSSFVPSFLARSPATASTIYAASTSTSTVYQSTDNGVTWTSMGAPGSSISGIVADFKAANTAYTFYNSGSSPLVYKTTNGGTSWSSIAGGLPANKVVAMAAGSDGATYAAVYYNGVYKSTNQGSSWTALNTSSTGVPPPVYPTANGLGLSQNDPNTIYVNTSGGVIFKSTNGGANWASAGAPPAPFSGIWVDPLNSSVLVGATANSPTLLYVSTDGATTWNPIAAELGIATIQVAFDYNNTSAAYAVAPVSGTAFVAKVNPSGTGLVYSTFLGGSAGATGYAIAANSAGDAFVTGYTSDVTTVSFPDTASALPSGGNPAPQGFIVHIQDATAPCSYTLSPLGTNYIPSTPTTGYFSVLAPSGCTWTATSDSPSWATIASGASGSGMGIVAVSIAPNTASTASSRTATITAGGQSAMVVQSAPSCSATLNPGSLSIPVTGGTYPVAVNVPSGCAWAVSNADASAISVNSGSPGSGSGGVSLSIAANPNPNPRAFTLTVANTNLIITQSGTCVYSLSATSALFGGASGTGSVGLTAVGTGCSWSASSNGSWLTINSSTSGVGSATISFSVAALTGTTRTASLTIAGLTFPVTQAPDQAYLVSTLAGGAMPPTTTVGTSVSIPVSYGVAVDASGNTYFPSPNLNAVFKVDASGALTRIAGTGVAGFSGDNGPALSAQLSYPRGVAVDTVGNVFIADSSNNRIRMVNTSGTISTAVGTGSCCFAGDGGSANNAWLNYPAGVAVDGADNLYIADTNNQRVRVVNNASWIITTLAGNGSPGYSGDGAAGSGAQLNNPNGVAVDAAGNVYIADSSNQRIRKVDGSGNITTVAGNGSSGFSGDGSAATSAQLNNPNGVAVDAAGNLYVADSNNWRIRKVTAGTITTVAGGAGWGYWGDSGPATSARLRAPWGVAVDGAGNLYITDFGNEDVRMVSAAGTISTLVGNGIGDGGLGVFGFLNQPYGVARDNAGNTYVSDTNHDRVRKVTATGTITTIAGTGVAGFSGDGGAAASAQLSAPRGLALDASGNLYIADSANYRIRKVDGSGNITTVAGNGNCCTSSGDSGPATSAQFGNIYGLAVDASRNLYLADGQNNVVRKVAASGTITTVAGNGTPGYSGDSGAATSAQLNTPYGVAVDTSGNLYIADRNNNRVRMVSTSGTITTAAGNGSSGYSGDGGAAASAQLNAPNGVAVDAAGDLYIADGNNQRIREVVSGTIATVAGNGNGNYSGDGGPAASATFRNPFALSVDSAGNLAVAEQNNNTLRLLSPTGGQPVLAIQSAHTSSFTQGQNGAVYTLTAGNGPGAGATNGTVVVNENLPAGLTLVSMVGPGWTCGVPGPASCMRSDALSGGAFYPPITVTVNVSASASAQLTNQASVTGGGASGAGATDLTIVAPSSAPAAPALVSPANGATGVSVTGSLTWNPSSGATSYDLYFGTTSTPPLVVSTTNTSIGGGGALNPGTTYYWAVGARNSAGANVSSVWSFATSCVSALNPSSAAVGVGASTGSITVTATSGCGWTAVSNAAWITINSGGSGTGNGTVGYSVAANTGAPRAGTITIAGLTFTITQSGFCGYSLSAASALFGGTGGSGSVGLTASSTACTWSASSSNSSWLTITSGSSGAGSGTIGYLVAALTGATRQATLTIAGLQVVVTQTPDQPYLISTLAGGAMPPTEEYAGLATVAVSNGVATDLSGNVYFASPSLSSVFKVDTNQMMWRIAGTGAPGYSGDGGLATSAQLSYPQGVALDAAGNVYIADSSNQRVRKVSASGIITTVAGNGSCCETGDGGAATSASLNWPVGVAVDSSGNLYIADQYGNKVREVSAAGTIGTAAGNGTYGYSGDGGAATSAELAQPEGVAVDASGNLYVADTNNNRIRKVSSGNISTVAGNGVCCGYSGDGGAATSAQLSNPEGIAVDSAGDLFIADTNSNRVREVTAGTISTVAGNGAAGLVGDGGVATSAAIWAPAGVALDASGNLYIADAGNQRIAEVTAAGIIFPLTAETFDGGSLSVTLNQPTALARDSSGDTYIAESNAHRVRKITPTGMVQTVAGTGVFGYSGDSGPAMAAKLNYPQGVAVDSSGNLYIADAWNNRVRKVAASGGIITTFAGNGQGGYSGDNGAATSAQLWNPAGLAFDAAGNLYIADAGNNRVRKVAVGTGIITTVAGTGTMGYSGDGGAATSAELSRPFALALDSSGNLYIADANSSRIREVSGGTITTVAGNGVCCGFSGDEGAATSAQLANPAGIAVDSSGNLYITDSGNRRVRKVAAASGIITTIAGTGNTGYAGDGGPASEAFLQNPSGLVIDSSGNLYVGDQTAVRLLTPINTNPVLTIQSVHSGSFTQGQSGSYALLVTNAVDAGSTNGLITVYDDAPTGTTMTSISGSGWSCTLLDDMCTRSDALAGGASYPPIAVTASVSSTAPFQLSNFADLYVGPNTLAAATTDLTVVAPSGAPAAPVLIAPANGVMTGFTPTLSWNPSTNATSYDVYFGASSTPPLVTNITETSYSPGTLSAAQTYYWAVGARNSAGANASSAWSFNTSCAQALNPASVTVGSAASTGSEPVNGFGMCSWSATSNTAWITVTSGASGFATGAVGYSVAANTGAQRVGTITIAGQTFTITQSSSPLATTSYLVSTIAGGMNLPPTVNNGMTASLPVGYNVAVDASGNVYFPSPNLNAVFELSSSGALTRVAGTGAGGYYGDGGQALSAHLSNPFAVAVDALGNLYIADTLNNAIRMVSTTGVITTVAGNGTMGYSGDGGAATSATLSQPYGVTVDAAGNIYISDQNNQRVRKVSGGVITTVAGTGAQGYSGDGGAGTSASLNNPDGLAVDASGNLYIADASNNRVRKVNTSGIISTVAGSGGCCYSGDGGAATSANLDGPNGVAVDAAGDLFIADTSNSRIREVSASGIISTIAGDGAYGFSGYGGPAVNAQLANPFGVAVDSSGNVYISDYSSQRIRNDHDAGGRRHGRRKRRGGGGTGFAEQRREGQRRQPVHCGREQQPRAEGNAEREHYHGGRNGQRRILRRQRPGSRRPTELAERSHARFVGEPVHCRYEQQPRPDGGYERQHHDGGRQWDVLRFRRQRRGDQRATGRPGQPGPGRFREPLHRRILGLPRAQGKRRHHYDFRRHGITGLLRR
jgi:sugar lactone lactonase YvrE